MHVAILTITVELNNGKDEVKLNKILQHYENFAAQRGYSIYDQELLYDVV